jgi:hypothetical protein
MDVIYLDLAKAFDKVPHKRLLEKVKKHGIGGKLLDWIEDWLKNRRQRVCLQGILSNWIKVVSGVHRDSVLGPILFLIFINDLDNGIISSIFKFADDTKLLGRVEDSYDKIVLQGDLDLLVEWSKELLMRFDASKCKVMHVGKKNKRYDYVMEGQILDSVDEEKDLGVVLSSDMKCSSQCQKAYNTANRMLGMIKRTICFKSPWIMVKLYKTLVRPHLEYCVSAWAPLYKKDKALLERIQHRFTWMIKEVRCLEYVDRLKYLKLWTLEERRNRSDLLEVFKMYTGLSDLNFEDFFELDKNVKGTRGHSAKLVKIRCKGDIRRHFFSLRVVSRWNNLDDDTVTSRSINIFKSKLDKIRETRMGFFMD